MLIYAALLIGLGWAFVRLPGGFLPVDDQGFITTDVQTPSDSSYARTEAAVEKVEKYLLRARRRRERDVPHRLQLPRPGHEHRAGLHLAEGLVGARAEGFCRRDRRRHQPRSRRRSATPRFRRCSRRRSTISATPRASRSACRTAARRAIRRWSPPPTSLIAEANASPVLQKVYVEGLPPAPQVNLMIDREKAGAFGVTFEDINSTISTNLGSNYINDFPNRGRMQRVIVQADRASRMNADDILNYNVKNSRGQLVPFSAFATDRMVEGARPRSPASTTIPRCASAARRGPASPPATPSPRWSGWPSKLPRGFGYRMDRTVAAGKAVGLAGAVPARPVGAGGVLAARRAL